MSLEYLIMEFLSVLVIVFLEIVQKGLKEYHIIFCTNKINIVDNKMASLKIVLDLFSNSNDVALIQTSLVLKHFSKRHHAIQIIYLILADAY